jgi:hypothetical protein
MPPRKSFVERNRNRLLSLGAAVVLIAAGALIYFTQSAPAYACSITWQAPTSPTPTPAPSATPRLGYLQDDMGRSHVAVGSKVTYVFCPPASGSHYNSPGIAGPIPAKVYGPNDKTVPQNWIHNMEHGGLVLLYSCPGGTGDGCTDAGQLAMRNLFSSFPNSPVCNIPPGNIGPVMTRFDDMTYPYAALVWDEVLPLQTLDAEQIKAFFLQQAERTNPEPQCAAPSAAPGPTDTTAPPSASPSVAPSAGSSAAPGASCVGAWRSECGSTPSSPMTGPRPGS